MISCCRPFFELGVSSLVTARVRALLLWDREGGRQRIKAGRAVQTWQHHSIGGTVHVRKAGEKPTRLLQNLFRSWGKPLRLLLGETPVREGESKTPVSLLFEAHFPFSGRLCSLRGRGEARRTCRLPSKFPPRG